MTKYRFKHWEDSNLINPERVINITEDMQVTAYYEEATEVSRKGLPSQSGVVSITVHPKAVGGENTVLTLKADKTECTSEDPLVVSGVLFFEVDAAPLVGRVIELYQEGVKIAQATTLADGSFTISLIAPTVLADTLFNYQAAFAGDP